VSVRVVDDYGKRECILKEFRKFGLGKVVIQSLEGIAPEK